MTVTSSWKIVAGVVSRTDLLQPSARRYRGARPCSACGALGHNIRTCKDARAVRAIRAVQPIVTKVFTEAEYRADTSKVVAHAIATGSAIVQRTDGSPRVVISIPPADLANTKL